MAESVYVSPEGYYSNYQLTSTPDSLVRKTWSAPNKDPFGAEELQREINKQFDRREELEDPLQRNRSQAGQSHGSRYEPSFGSAGAGTRARRGGGYNATTVSERGKYLQELEEQMQEKKKRKEREKAEAATDWWEKKKPAENGYKMPHPSQVLIYYEQ